jgi:hypothetical protein
MAGRPVYAHAGLRLMELDAHDPEEQAGTCKRAKEGRFDEELPLK